MREVKESRLPGVGARFEFTSKDGTRVGVIHHRSGRREILLADSADPDALRPLLSLDEEDSRTLAELLGSSRISEQLAELQQRVEGLAIDWLPIPAGSAYSGRTIGEAMVRTRTGVSIVAVLRGDQAVPSPGPDFRLQADDYLVVVGTPRGIERVVELLSSG